MYRLALSSLVVAALAAVVFLVPAWGGSAKSPGLVGEVGPGYSIEVKKAGKDLKTIKAGTYRIKVEDKASIHNFHLSGPGLNKKTGIGFKGDTTWTIKLKPGRYTYKCDPHAALGMKGTFKVTA
jgi:plastocyanin